MPFSKGRMAQALVLAGADPERAYQLALRIERAVRATAADEIPIDELHGMVEDVLAREEGQDLVSRYHGWREVLRLDRPLMLLIGGATGTGKSTLATEIAYRLGISRITSTDVIRQAMRAFFAQELMPELHYSSFDAAEGLKIPLPDPDDEDRALYGFIQQAGQVAVGANAVVERAVLEGLSTVVEGVHVVPGLVTAEQHAGAVVVQLMLTISDEESHQAPLLRPRRRLGRAARDGALSEAVRRDPPDPGVPGGAGREAGLARHRGGRSRPGAPGGDGSDPRARHRAPPRYPEHMASTERGCRDRRRRDAARARSGAGAPIWPR